MSNLRKGQIVAWVYGSGNWKVTGSTNWDSRYYMGKEYVNKHYNIKNVDTGDTAMNVRRKDVITPKENFYKEFVEGK